MAKETVQVEVEKSAYEIIEAISRAARMIKAAKAGGMSAELGAAGAAAVSEIPGLIANLPNLGSDLAEDKVEFIKGANLAVYDLAAALFG